MPDDALGFFRRYREALVAGDLDALAAAYRVPLPVIRPDRLRVVEDRAALRDELGKIHDTWRWLGMTDVALVSFRADGFDPGLHVASLVWRPMNAEGEEIAHVDVTYALRRVADGARIAAILAHNEERRRMPLVTPSGWRPFEADQIGVAPRRNAAGE
jgi:hypothetical protein